MAGLTAWLVISAVVTGIGAIGMLVVATLAVRREGQQGALEPGSAYAAIGIVLMLVAAAGFISAIAAIVTIAVTGFASLIP